MPYAELKKRLDAGEIVILDGATGTELQRRGISMDAAAWSGTASLGNQAVLSEIHSDYIAAGAEVITANTFASSRVVLEQAGYGDKTEEINRNAVEAALRARDVAGRDVAVAGSLSHQVIFNGRARAGKAQPTEAEAGDSFQELAEILKAAGVDLLLLEMMYHPALTPLVVEAALATGLPVWFGLSARQGRDDLLLSSFKDSDVHLREIVQMIPATGIDAAGCMHTNVGITGATLNIVRAHFEGPLMAYPDSGYFQMPDWRFHDIIAPDRLEDFYTGWLAQGAQIIGGCCGLTAEHIRAAVRARDRFLNAR